LLVITIRCTIRPEWTDTWQALVEELTRATRAEEDDARFQWFRDGDDSLPAPPR
jgi:quinol monooxygenase YgiN